MNVLLLSGQDNQSGYGMVCKVWIERFDCIPNTIELVGKTPKTNDKWEACKQCLIEASTWWCEHLGVIKVLAIHSKTMEAHTLWWNGGTFLKNVGLEHEVFTCYGQLNVIVEKWFDMEWQKWLVIFRWNRVKMTWAFMNIMSVIKKWDFAQWFFKGHHVAFSIWQMLCTLVCVIGVKVNTCKRWLHLCMFFSRSKMPLMPQKWVAFNYFLYMVSSKLQIPFDIQ